MCPNFAPRSPETKEIIHSYLFLDDLCKFELWTGQCGHILVWPTTVTSRQAVEIRVKAGHIGLSSGSRTINSDQIRIIHESEDFPLWFCPCLGVEVDGVHVPDLVDGALEPE